MTIVIARYYSQAAQIATLRSLTSWVWCPTESAADHLIRRARQKGVRGRFERVRVGGWRIEVTGEQEAA